MSDLLQAILLGTIQGLTEFLPVSSSGHLVLAQQALGEAFNFANEALVFDLVLHVGTLLPVLWFYRADFANILSALLGGRRDETPEQVREHRNLALYVVAATIPTGLMGVLFKDLFEQLFHSVTAVCIALMFTGGLLYSTRLSENDSAGQRPLTLRSALIIGVAQGFAITPGISRSGTTIAVALLLGIGRAEAARFSFLLSVPAICGAVVLQLKDGLPTDHASMSTLLAGFTSAMAVGYMALVMLVALVRRGGLYRFAYYVWPAAITAYVLLA